MTAARSVFAPVRHSREVTADRLLRTAAKHSYDPRVDVDWDAAPVPGLLYLPEHRVALYGTAVWDEMTLEQRVEFSKHQLASMHTVELWVETMLMQMLARHVYDADGSSAHAWHLWTEIAEECRHSTMFGRLIATMGCRTYRPHRTLHNGARVFKAVTTPAMTLAGALFFEEYGDALQRESAADESVQPIVRQISRIHVIEEARHLTFARDELARRLPRMPRWERFALQGLAGPMGALVADSMVHPGVYHHAGVDARTARRQAMANPHLHEMHRFASARAVEAFEELGLVTPVARAVWRRSHIVR